MQCLQRRERWHACTCSHLVALDGGGRVGARRVRCRVHTVEAHLADERDRALELLLRLT